MAARLMGSAAIALSELGSYDAAEYNAFLRRGIEQHPDTLRIAVEDLLAAPFETPNDQERATLVARDASGAWVGVVSVERERGRHKRRHIAWIYRMYVDAQRSGAGVGRALLRAAVARARACPGVQKINLTVAAHNQRAVGLYASEGFREFAREEDAFRDPTPRAELTMSLSLSTP